MGNVRPIPLHSLWIELTFPIMRNVERIPIVDVTIFCYNHSSCHPYLCFYNRTWSNQDAHPSQLPALRISEEIPEHVLRILRVFWLICTQQFLEKFFTFWGKFSLHVHNNTAGIDKTLYNISGIMLHNISYLYI